LELQQLIEGMILWLGTLVGTEFWMFGKMVLVSLSVLKIWIDMAEERKQIRPFHIQANIATAVIVALQSRWPSLA